MAFLAGAPINETTLVAVDRAGTATKLREERANYLMPRFSPDGRRVAVAIASPNTPDIWVHDLTRGSSSRLTFSPSGETYPVWTPDGLRIAYASGVPGNIFWVRADGSGKPERLTESPNAQSPASWSPDGKVLAFSEAAPKSSQDLWTLTIDGDRKPKIFLQTPASEFAPEFSPDGRWLAYTSDESGRLEVYVRPFPDTGGKWQVSTTGGAFPHWSRDGRELIYRVSGERVVTVPYTTNGQSFQPDRPRELFRDEFAVRGVSPTYDLAPDGKRFVMIQEVESAQIGSHITLIFNWFDDLKARARSR
jgi:eukaryotic-like serine/threonine-protein kinase